MGLKRKEKFSIRKYKKIGTASVLLGTFFLVSSAGIVFAEEVEVPQAVVQPITVPSAASEATTVSSTSGVSSTTDPSQSTTNSAVDDNTQVSPAVPTASTTQTTEVDVVGQAKDGQPTDPVSAETKSVETSNTQVTSVQKERIVSTRVEDEQSKAPQASENSLSSEVAVVEEKTAAKSQDEASLSAANTQAQSAAVTTLAMYRLYNPNSGEHFYTSNGYEKVSLVKLGWRDENVAWYAPTKGEEVYRLYNPNAGDHHYTLNKGEMTNLSNLGWRYEGIAWYSAGTIAMYRLYNPNAKSGSHHYTASKSEVVSLTKLGWRYEDVAWYGMRSQDKGTEQNEPVTTTPIIKVTNYQRDKGNLNVVVMDSEFSKPIKQVLVAAWSENNQGNIYWYTSSNMKDGRIEIKVDEKYHHNLAGNYQVHVYIDYLDQTRNGFVLGSYYFDKVNGSHDFASNYKGTGLYSLSINKVYSKGDVLFAVWSQANGQDDIKWYSANRNGTSASVSFNVSQHSGIGTYLIHVYQNDNGKMYFLTSGNIQVKKTTYDTPYYSQRDARWAGRYYGISNIDAAGCVPTSLAMVFTALSGNTILPTQVADYLYYNTVEFNRGTFGTTGRGVLMASNHWGYKATPLGSYSNLVTALQEGHHVLAAVQNDKFVLHGSHELVLRGYSNGATYVRDPYTPSFSGWYPVSNLWREQSTDPVDTAGVGAPFIKITDA